jgi:predicted ribosomally synthesized peptide with SipW-like signal peptide
MKRILTSLVLILLVASVTASATSSYFTDQETLTGNSLTAGKLDVQLRGKTTLFAEPIVINLDTTQYFTGGLIPGVPSESHVIAVYNQGWGLSTIPLKYRWTANLTGGSDLLFNKLNVKYEDGNCWEPALPGDEMKVIYEGPLNGLNASPNKEVSPNITRCSWFTYTLPADAGNEYQALNSQFNLVLDATQLNNPGWIE